MGYVLRRFLLALVLGGWLAVLVVASPADAARSSPTPVPSLEPAATQKLWEQLVQDRREGQDVRPLNSTAVACRPARVVFYAATDWLRLATKLAASASSCADYFVSIPPLAADKTQLRGDQAWRIRALGPRFHALAEISWNGWSGWVATNGRTWYEAGVEARRRMALTGYDVGLGDSWALNELSSAARRGDGTARASAREFVRGLHDGDGVLPVARGVVFTAGIAQSTTNLGTYKANLQAWYADAPFWADMNAYVSDWSQEVYGDVRAYAVAGASAETRRDALNEYLQHEVTLANAGPGSAAGARTFLQAAHSPLGNAAWAWDSAFGWTAVPFEQMQDYVSAQVYAARAFDAASTRRNDRFGFAWSPKNLFGATTADYNARTAAVLDRLAAAIRDSGQPFDETNPGAAACGPDGQNLWCFTVVSGAAFNPAWRTFAEWLLPTVAFMTAPTTIPAGEASPEIVLELRDGGITKVAAAAVPITLTSSSSGGEFAATAAGPWSATITVTIPAGSSTAGFFYRDRTVGSPVLTAGGGEVQATTQVQTVVAASTVAPRSVPADFDADGDTDLGFYRPSSGVWVIRGQEWVHYPLAAGDVPVPADYDGDGDTDIAFYQRSTGMWVIRGQDWVHFPASSGDVLLPADYDGDGDADLAFYRPSTGVWVIRGQEWAHYPAQADDVLLPADYDGDGDVDIAFYRPSTGVWVIRGQEWVHYPLAADDVPLPADYDGDGDTDIAFYQRSTGMWVIRGQEWVQFPGLADDSPLPLPQVLRPRVVP